LFLTPQIFWGFPAARAIFFVCLTVRPQKKPGPLFFAVFLSHGGGAKKNPVLFTNFQESGGKREWGKKNPQNLAPGGGTPAGYSNGGGKQPCFRGKGGFDGTENGGTGFGIKFNPHKILRGPPLPRRRGGGPGLSAREWERFFFCPESPFPALFPKTGGGPAGGFFFFFFQKGGLGGFSKTARIAGFRGGGGGPGRFSGPQKLGGRGPFFFFWGWVNLYQGGGKGSTLGFFLTPNQPSEKRKGVFGGPKIFLGGTPPNKSPGGALSHLRGGGHSEEKHTENQKTPEKGGEKRETPNASKKQKCGGQFLRGPPGKKKKKETGGPTFLKTGKAGGEKRGNPGGPGGKNRGGGKAGPVFASPNPPPRGGEFCHRGFPGATGFPKKNQRGGLGKKGGPPAKPARFFFSELPRGGLEFSPGRENPKPDFREPGKALDFWKNFDRGGKKKGGHFSVAPVF